MAREQGFSLLEALVALVIASMAAIAVSQAIAGAARARAAADTLCTAAMLADTVIEYAVLPGNPSQPFIDSTIRTARSDGWEVDVVRQPGFAGEFEEIRVRISGRNLQEPFEVRRLVAGSRPVPEGIR